MGKGAEHIFKVLPFGEGDEKKFAKVIEKFEDYIISKKNIIHERASFIAAFNLKRRRNSGGLHLFEIYAKGGIHSTTWQNIANWTVTS